MANISQNWLDNLDILEPYTSRYNSSFYGSQLAKTLKLPQRTVARKLDILKSAGILKHSTEGKNKMYYIDLQDRKSLVFLNLIENYKAMDFFSKHKNISLAIKELMRFGTAILFGSYAKGYPTSESDIDILLFARKSNTIKNMLKKYPFEINIHYSTFDRFKSLLKQNNALAKEIAENHIIFGNAYNIVEELSDYYG